MWDLWPFPSLLAQLLELWNHHKIKGPIKGLRMALRVPCIWWWHGHCDCWFCDCQGNHDSNKSKKKKNIKNVTRCRNRRSEGNKVGMIEKWGKQGRDDSIKQVRTQLHPTYLSTVKDVQDVHMIVKCRLTLWNVKWNQQWKSSEAWILQVKVNQQGCSYWLHTLDSPLLVFVIAIRGFMVMAT